MDYAALAKQYGGSIAPAGGAVDYAALAKQYGGEMSAAQTRPPNKADPNPFLDVNSLAMGAGEGIVSGAQKLDKWLRGKLPGLPAEPAGNVDRLAAVREFLNRGSGADPNSTEFKVGEVLGPAAVTYPIGGALGAGAKLASLPRFGNALASFGGSTGAALKGATLPARAADLGIRAAGGAVSGGAAAGLMNPDEALLGAGIGGAVPVAGAIVNNPLTQMAGRGAINTLRGFSQGGRDIIKGNIANNLAGSRAPEVMAALERNGVIVPGSMPNAGQAATSAGSAEFAALQALAEKRAPSEYAARDAMQEQARVNALRDFGKTPEAIAAAETERTAATKPLREDALSNANIGGVLTPQLTDAIAEKQLSRIWALRDQQKFAHEAFRNDKRANEWLPVPGQPRFPGRYSPMAENVTPNLEAASDAGKIAVQRQAEKNFRQMQLESLASAGHFPLGSAQIIDGINAKAGAPGLRASEVVRKTMSDLKQKIADLTDEAGVIDSRDLYTVRKEIGNTIQTHAKETNNWDKRLTAGLERDVQKNIDDAIERAGGDSWKQYLSKYAELSKPIDQMKVGQALEAKLSAPLTSAERPAMFAQAMRDQPGTLKRSTGRPRYDSDATLGDVLTPGQVTATENVLRDLARNAKTDKLAAAGMESARRKLDIAVKPDQPPALLNRVIMVAKEIIKRTQGGATEKTMEELAKDMLDPKKVADLMRRATPKEREVLLKFKSGPATNALVQSGVQSGD